MGKAEESEGKVSSEFANAFQLQGYRVIVHKYLPAATMMVSEDIYEALKEFAQASDPAPEKLENQP